MTRSASHGVRERAQHALTPSYYAVLSANLIAPWSINLINVIGLRKDLHR